MKQHLYSQLFKRSVITSIFGILVVFSTLGQTTLPTAAVTAKAMTIGWNIGNTLEAIGGETAWGNPLVTQKLIDSVKAAGFNTIRIPVAWDIHANQTTNVIDAVWMARVKQIVDYCINRNLYVIINIHWDNGWLENNCTTDKQVAVNAKQKTYWTQIANTFKAYDGHVLFASANEPNVDNATQMTVLLSYHQTFINAVRATGGNNTTRTLIIQGPSTDIDKTNTLMNTLPSDPTANRLMIEIHYYPYQFSLMTADATWGNQFFYWGSGNHSTTDAAHNPTWGEETDTDAFFQKMKAKFVDKGFPVIIGEFGAIKRTGTLTGANLALHIKSREAYYAYVAKSAVCHGMIPVYWDTGYIGDNSMTLFDRNSGVVVDKGALKALITGTNNCGVVTAVEETKEKQELSFYPNPFTQQLTIKCNGTFKFTIFNPNGTELESGNAAESMILGKNYSTGMYIIKVQQNETTKVIRVVKE